MEKRYHTASEQFSELFGGKTYKISLSGGMTCPTRDGHLDTRGCIFCSAGGSGEFAEPYDGCLASQIERAKARVRKKAGEHPRYLAYFQSYTNTYAPTAYLRTLYEAALAAPDIVGLSVATRPDCLEETTLDLLGELACRVPVFVELGLQTTCPRSVAYIRRGYPTEVYDRAVTALKRRGIHTVTHIIFGLPGETREDMMATVRHTAEMGSEGVKLQLLQVLAGTDLAEDYRAGKFATLTPEEYYSLVGEALTLLPADTVIHRLTGDPPKRLLIAPLWAADKKRVRADMARYFDEHDIRAGSRYDK